jgi:peptidoglycan/LPS O-acetylase OafA/YrhL
MRVRVVIAVILLLVGGVWFGQGVGLIGGSFMTGEAIWAVIGAVCIVLAGALLVGVQRERRRRSL